MINIPNIQFETASYPTVSRDSAKREVLGDKNYLPLILRYLNDIEIAKANSVCRNWNATISSDIHFV